MPEPEPSYQPYLPPDPRYIAEIGANGGGVEALKQRSPIPVWNSAREPRSEQVIDALFPAECLLCVAVDKTDAITGPREQMRGFLSDMQFIVPSPMSAITGTTQDGTPSERCLNNTGPRRFLVTESDIADANRTAQLLLLMAEMG